MLQAQVSDSAGKARQFNCTASTTLVRVLTTCQHLSVSLVCAPCHPPANSRLFCTCAGFNVSATVQLRRMSSPAMQNIPSLLCLPFAMLASAARSDAHCCA